MDENILFNGIVYGGGVFTLTVAIFMVIHGVVRQSHSPVWLHLIVWISAMVLFAIGAGKSVDVSMTRGRFSISELEEIKKVVGDQVAERVLAGNGEIVRRELVADASQEVVRKAVAAEMARFQDSHAEDTKRVIAAAVKEIKTTMLAAQIVSSGWPLQGSFGNDRALIGGYPILDGIPRQRMGEAVIPAPGERADGREGGTSQ